MKYIKNASKKQGKKASSKEEKVWISKFQHQIILPQNGSICYKGHQVFFRHLYMSQTLIKVYMDLILYFMNKIKEVIQ